MLSVVRFAEGGPEAAFLTDAEAALAVLAGRPGYVRGALARSTDHGGGWVLVTEWESVGAWRRALGSYDAKVLAAPFLARALDEPSAYEVLLAAEPRAAPVRGASDRG